MATLTERLSFLISANADQAIREFQKTGNAAEKELTRTTKSLDKVAGNLTKFGAGAMAFAGVAGTGLLAMAKASEDAEMQSRKLANSIANSGNYAAGAQKRLEDLAKATMQVTVADDDAIVGAQALLVQFGLTEQQVITLTPLIVDLSRKMGIDMDTAAKAVAKSVDGTSTALKRMGIDVRATKDGGDAFTNTVDALRSSVGGFAREEAETFSGKLEKLKVSLGNLAEGVGSGVVDAFSGFANVAVKASDALGNLSPELQTGVGKVAAYGTAAIGLAGALSFTAGQAIKMRERFHSASGELNNFGKAAKYAGMALSAIAISEGIFSLMNAISDDAGNVTRKLQAMTIATEDYANGAGNAESAMKAFRDQVAAMGKGLGISNVFKSFGKEVKIVGGSIGRDIEYIDEAFNKLLETSPKMARALLDAWRSQAQGLDQSSQQYKDNMMLIERYEDRLNLATGAQDALTRVTDDGTSSASDFSDAVEDESEAMQAYREELEKAEKAASDLLDAQISAIDAQFSYENQVVDTAQAIAEWAQANSDAAISEADKAEALRTATTQIWDQAQAAVTLREEWATANGETLSARDRQALLRQELYKVAQTLSPSDPLRRNIMGLIDDIDEVPTDVHTSFTADSTQATRVVDGWERRLIESKAKSGKSAEDIGRATADGIERGIQAREAFIIRSMNEFLDSVLAASRARLGIRSPSEVMADEVGRPIAEGIAEGVNDGAHLVAGALDDVGDLISERAAAIVQKSTDEIADVLDAAQDAFDDVLDSIDDRRDEEEAAARVAEAEQNVVEAQEELQRVLQESGRDSDDYRRAQEQLEDAQDDLRDANYRLLQSSYDLIGAGAAGVSTFERIAQAAGLTKAEIQKLIDKYRELAAAQAAAEQSNAIQTPINQAEAAAVNQAYYQAELDQAIEQYRGMMNQWSQMYQAHQNTASLESEMAALLIKASKSYALSRGLSAGTTDFYKAQLDLMRYLISNQVYLVDNVASYVRALEASVPGYASGGIVTRPTLAMVGERGPEAIIPLTNMQKSTPMVVNIHVNGADPNQVVDALKRYARQNGAIPVRTMAP